MLKQVQKETQIPEGTQVIIQLLKSSTYYIIFTIWGNFNLSNIFYYVRSTFSTLIVKPQFLKAVTMYGYLDTRFLVFKK